MATTTSQGPRGSFRMQPSVMATSVFTPEASKMVVCPEIDSGTLSLVRNEYIPQVLSRD